MDPSLLDIVADPSDFPIESLQKLDSSLRCTICKDFFDGPVVLHCGHTFCSLCIRTALPRESKCPTCLAAAKETHLVRNVIFEEAVTAWSNARALVLNFARESAKPRPTRRVKKRKLSHNSDYEAGTPKPARSAGKDLSFQSGEEQSEEEESYRLRKSVQCAIDEEVLPSSDPEEQELGPARANAPVECPVCSRMVAFDFINAHMDSGCKTSITGGSTGAGGRAKPDSKAAWGSIFNARGKKAKASDTSSSKDSEIITEKVAKVSYDVITLSTLRKLLAEKGLSTQGEKAELEQRHRRWTAICNANLDRTERRTVGELKQQLQEAEDATSRPGPKQVKDGHEKAWTLKNKAQFAELIEHARPKPKGLEARMDSPSSPSTARRQTSAGPSSSSITQAPSSSDVIEID